MWKIRTHEGCTIGPLLLAGLFSALFFTGCGSQTGSVEGLILVRTPHVSGFHPLVFETTVNLRSRSNGKLIKSEMVPPRGKFHFTVAAGSYKVVVTGIRNCTEDVVVKSGQSLNSEIRCNPAPLA